MSRYNCKEDAVMNDTRDTGNSTFESENDKKTRLKTTLFAVFILILVFCLIMAIVYIVLKEVAPDIIELLKSGDQKSIEEYVRGTGAKGAAVLFVLQYLQVVSIIISGIPIQITAGIVLGSINGFIICYSANFISNLTVFIVARKIGGKRVRDILGSRNNRFDFIGSYQYPGFMVMLACLMPVIPNGIIPYIASMSKVSIKGFCTGVLLGSFSGTLLFCCIGGQIMQGNFAVAIILCSLQIVGVIVMMKEQEAVVTFLIRMRNRYFNKKRV